MTRAEIEAKCEAFAKNLWLEFASDDWGPEYNGVKGFTLTLKLSVRGKPYHHLMLIRDGFELPTAEQLDGWHNKVARSVRSMRDGGQP